MFLGNVVIDLAKYAARALHHQDVADDHSTPKLISFGASLENKQLDQCKIPLKFKFLLEDMREVK
jgi:hypothetical protein